MNISSTVQYTLQVTTESYSLGNEVALSTYCNGTRNDVPDAPVNLTLLGIFTTSVLLQWNLICDLDTTTGTTTSSSSPFAIHVYPLTSNWVSDGDLLTFVITKITGDTRQYKLQNLIPETLYNVYLTSANEFGSSNNSDVLTFRTLTATSLEYHKIEVKPIEVVLVFSILTAWFLTIVMFLRKWGTIRISQPGGQSKLYHQPKNLENIKVVNTANDSVIHRSYGKDYHRTLQARQKRLDQMHTVPNIKFQPIRSKQTKYGPPPTASLQKSSMVGRALAENYPKPGLGNFKPLMPPGMKLKPKLNAKVGSIDNHVLDIFPEELLEQSDKEESLEDLGKIETKLDMEAKDLVPVKNQVEKTDMESNELQPSEAANKEDSQVWSAASQEEQHKNKPITGSKQEHADCLPERLPSKSRPDKHDSTDVTIQFIQKQSDDGCHEEILRSTTV